MKHSTFDRLDKFATASGGVLLALLALAPLARASSDAAYEAVARNPRHEWTTLALAALNFAVLIFLLRRYAGPLVQNFFFQRSESIRKDLEQAQTRLRAAEDQREELRGRLSSIEAEVERLLTRLAEQTGSEHARALARAEHTALRIEIEAQRVAEREIERARTALRAEAAGLAANLAAEILRHEVRPEDHDRLVEEFISRVESSAP